MNICICCSTTLEPWIRFPCVPSTGRFYERESDAAAFTSLHLSFCRNCGLIAQLPKSRGPSGTIIDYVNVERSSGHQFPSYHEKLFKQVKESLGALDGIVLEVGCNDGTFMAALKKEGCKNVVGVEPSLACSARAEQKGLRVVKDYFTRTTAARWRADFGSARVVLARHVLEHVSDPEDFLGAVADVMAPGGTLIIEVPDSQNMVERLKADELWEEHLWYFSRSSLTSLLRRVGFRIQNFSCEAHLSSINLLVSARYEGVSTGLRVEKTSPELTAKTKNFALLWKAHCAELLAQARLLKPPVFAIGASHPQQNFLVFSGLGQLIEGLIDENPEKRGRFMPVPKMKPIWSPEELRPLNGNYSLLFTAFGYDAWMTRLAQGLNDPSQVLRVLKSSKS